MLRKLIIFAAVVVYSCLSFNVLAQDQATPKEVYQMVMKASEVLQVLGEEGLEAFNSKGEFTWKDSYIFVVNCSELKIVAHPLKKRIGADLSKTWDKNKDKSQRKRQAVELCEGAKNPNGVWVEYWWEKLGEKDPSRKISFMIQVPNQPYFVTAGIYDETMSLEKLQQTQVSW